MHQKKFVVGKELALQVLKYLAGSSVEFNHASTLTFKYEPPDIIHAFRAFQYFSNRLNREIFGNNWRRKAKHDNKCRLTMIPAVEGSTRSDENGGIRLHYHFRLG